MTLPDVVPKKTVSGISVDPRTLDRVIPESKRADGTVRKEIRIRPGFTPQEDVSRFRSQRQQQVDRNALPKGHILGWVAPSSETRAKPGAAPGMGAGAKPSRNAQKHAKRKAKKAAEKEEKEKAAGAVPDNWEESDEEADKSTPAEKDSGTTETTKLKENPESATGDQKAENGNEQEVENLTEAVQKLDVQ